MTRSWFKKSTLDKAERVIKFGAAAIAAFWIAFQYYQKVQDDKRLKSLEVIKEFRLRPEYTQLIAQELMFSTPPAAQEAEKALTASDKADSLCPYKKYMDKILQGDQSPAAQYKLFVALDQIAVCANSGVCNANVLCDFLGRSIRVHLTTFCTFYDGVERQGRLRITWNLREFLASCKKYFKENRRVFDNELFCDEFRQPRNESNGKSDTKRVGAKRSGHNPYNGCDEEWSRPLAR
jgi:hypothetical protein